jgi:hypothetical protein|tara:strand:- start:479 stop:781 length:303 start_codon:yes stop_codon:yes gene_type:complete
MIPVKVISRVEIEPITEDVITKLLTAEMLKNNPNLVINSITYERKLTPSRMVAIVDAQMGDSSTSAPVTPSEGVTETDDTQVELELDEPKEAPVRKKVFG